MWGVEEEGLGLGLGDCESMKEAEGLGVVELPIAGDWSLWEAEDLRGETLRWMRGLLATEEVVKEGRLATLSWEPLLRSMDWRQERMRSEGAELKESRFEVREARVVVEGLRLRIFLEKVEVPSQFSARRRLR